MIDVRKILEPLERIAASEVEEFDEELRRPVLVPMSAEEAADIARATIIKARALAADIEALENRERVLREALAPFAAWFDVRETQRGLTGVPQHADDTPVFMAASIVGEALITIGDLRRVRAALEAAA